MVPTAEYRQFEAKPSFDKLLHHLLQLRMGPGGVDDADGLATQQLLMPDPA